MAKPRSRGTLAAVATVLILLVVTAGCARRGLPAGSEVGAAAGHATHTAEPRPAATHPATSAASATPDATEEAPAATDKPIPSPQPTAAPLEMPNLTAIEQLLADLDAALGADATADSEEGSAP